MPKMIVEMPKGTMVKYEINKETGTITVDRFIHVPVPFNYGFIANTHAADGDSEDVFLVGDVEALAPLSELEIEIVDKIEAIDNGDEDHKYIAVHIKDKVSLKEIHRAKKDIVRYLKTYKEGFIVK